MRILRHLLSKVISYQDLRHRSLEASCHHQRFGNKLQQAWSKKVVLGNLISGYEVHVNERVE